MVCLFRPLQVISTIILLVDYDIDEALAMEKDLDNYMFEMAKKLSR